MSYIFSMFMGGIGKVGKGLVNVASKPRSIEKALEVGSRFLGKGYTEVGRAGSGVFRSADGLRQFRMTASDITHGGKIGPHVHFEKFDPQTGIKIKNIHTPIY